MYGTCTSTFLEGLLFTVDSLRAVSYLRRAGVTNGTNVTQRRISIEKTRYDILITIVMYVTEQIMENLEPRSVALGSRRREYAHSRQRVRTKG